MTARLPILAFMGISLGIHAAFVSIVSVSEGAPLAAGPPPALVSQGNSFADLVEGIQDADPDVEKPVETAELMEEQVPPPTTQPTPSERLDAPDPTVIRLVEPGLQLRADEMSLTQPAIPATVVAPDTSVADVPAAEPVATVVTSLPLEVPAAAQVTTVQTVPMEPAATADAERVEALPEEQVQLSARPRARPANLVRAPKPVRQAKKKAPPRQAAAAPRGNSRASAQRGQSTGTAQAAAAAEAGQGGQAAAAASQAARRAAAGYTSTVMRKISRTRRDRARTRGVATIAFTVAPSGGLASLSVLRSSGDGSLDQIALNHLRRTAPFPAPPPGAQRSFTIDFRGR